MSFIKSRFRSFKHAGNGIRILIQSEIHAKIHLIASLLVIILASFLELSRIEFALLLFAIGMVWVAEAINTAIEKIMDLLHPGHHPKVGIIKDLAAGAVLIASICAAVIGFLILGPPLWLKIN